MPISRPFEIEVQDSVPELRQRWQLRRVRQRREFAQTMLAMHLLNHERTELAQQENRVQGLEEHMHWQADFTTDIIALARRQGLVEVDSGLLLLTPNGRERAQRAMVYQTAR